jgi:carbon-monoxide dehydrogenase large subunit
MSLRGQADRASFAYNTRDTWWKESVLAETHTGRYIGQPVRRFEDRALVTGAGRYVDDIKLPGTLHLAFVRSPYAHARIRGVDTAAAAAAPGIVRILTAADVQPRGRPAVNQLVADLRLPPFPVLFGERVTAIGQPVAAVVAETRDQARDAAELVAVDYEPLDPLVDPQEALREGAPLVYPELGSNVAFVFRRGDGDVDAAFARAAHVTRLTIAHQRLQPFPLEPRGVLASYDPATDSLTLWDSTQSVFRVRAALATVLGLPEPRIRVIAPDVGGSFGAKGSVYREEMAVAFAARLLGRPVKWIATRSEDFLALSHGRGMVTEAELALAADGTFLGLRIRNVLDLGADFLLNSGGPALRFTTMAPGCYRFAAAAVETIGVYTTKPPTAPYRGAGRPEATLTIERLVDTAARELNLDPVELRRRNVIRPDEFPYKTATGLVYDSGNYAHTLDVALQAADYSRLRREQAQARARGELMGIGVATFVEPSGGGWESGAVWVDQSGQVIVHTGATPHGQGHLTTFAQIVAERLGVDIAAVTVRCNDTAVVPVGAGTGGSRSLTVAGNALVRASDAVLDKAKRIAAHLLEAAPQDVVAADGRFHLAGIPDRAVTWAQVARAAYTNPPPGEMPGLEASAFFQGATETFGFGTYIAVVRVDRETGDVTIERLVAVDDCGVVINPLLVTGQVLGGIAQGLGQALLEELRFDENGQLITGTLMDYAVPVAASMPPISLDHTVTPSPLNPLGTKGVGESGTIGAPPAVVNAVVDALAPLGVRHIDLPLASEKLWRILAQTRSRS